MSASVDARRATPATAPTHILRRVGFGVAALLLVVVALQVGAAGALREFAPQIALRFAPADGVARARLAEVFAGAGIAEYDRAAMTLAQSSVERSPLSANAIGVIGRIGDSSDDPSIDAGEVMQAAERLSKREPEVMLWLAQNALKVGKPGEAIDYFDLALRSSITARGLLFPAIAAAATQPDVTAGLVARLKERPTWRDTFTVYLIDESPDKLASATLLAAYLDPRNRNDSSNARSMVFQLAQAEHYQRAWEFMNQFGLAGPARRPDRLADSDFETLSTVQPFAWSLADQSDLWAEIVPAPDGDGRVLAVNATTATGGAAATQLVRLSPGRYRVSAKVGSFGGDRSVRPSVTVQCASGTAPPQAMGAQSQNDAAPMNRISGAFTVAPTCPFQLVSIVVANTGGSGWWVDDVVLSRN